MTAPLVAVDIGNSSTNLGLFAAIPAAGGGAGNQALIAPDEAWSLATIDIGSAETSRPLSKVAHNWFVASVQSTAERELAEWLTANRPGDRFTQLTYLDLPLTIKVDHPELVGRDRLLAAHGANLLRDEGRGAVIVDIGTAITVDALSATGAFLGGSILPGPALQARVLAEGTDQLPQLVAALDGTPPPEIGRNTAEAMRSGVYWGLTGGVRELVSRIAVALGGSPHVFVTGGAGDMLAPRIGHAAEYAPHLILSAIAAVAASRSIEELL